MNDKINPIQARILTVLIKHGDYMNTTEIAKKAGVSWNTALSYLKMMENKGWVQSAGDTKKDWIANT